MNKILFALILLPIHLGTALTVSDQPTQIACVNDYRAVDGPVFQLYLSKEPYEKGAPETYRASLTTIHSTFKKPLVSKVILATKLKCTFSSREQLLVTCSDKGEQKVSSQLLFNETSRAVVRVKAAKYVFDFNYDNPSPLSRCLWQ